MASRAGATTQYPSTYVNNAVVSVVRTKTLNTTNAVFSSLSSSRGYVIGNGSSYVNLFTAQEGEMGILSFTTNTLVTNASTYGGMFIYSYCNGTGTVTTLSEKPGGVSGVDAKFSGAIVQGLNNTLTCLWRKTRIN